MNYKEAFIEFMVRSKVLTFGDFITKSGRKTPYFVNTGNYKTSEQIAKLGQYYAACIKDHLDDIDFLYGPAYKGIPLVIAASASLYRDHHVTIPYCFNRKEAKDHGEGGQIIGYRPQNGDTAMIVEDVITAGTSVKETVPLLKSLAEDVKVARLIISVDRMEKGDGGKTAIEEIADRFGIATTPIVTIKEIVACLHNREVDGRVVIDNAMKARIEAHLAQYGV
jgi:orotate phosphoribosyltransferase